MALRAIISDFDNMLAKTEHMWPALDEQYFTSVLGVERWGDWKPRLADWKKTGIPMPGIMAECIKQYGLPGCDPEQMKLDREDVLLAAYEKDIRPMPGAVEILDLVREHKLKLAIASGMSLRILEGALKILGWRERVDYVCSTHELGHGKPSPSVFLLACARTGFTPRECLILENDLNGAKAARASTMPFLVLPDSEERRTAIAKEGIGMMTDIAEMKDALRSMAFD